MSENFSSLSKSYYESLSSNDSRPQVFRIKKGIPETWGSRAKRPQRLLAEFLQEESARQRILVEEETSSEDVGTEVQNQVTLSDDLLFKILVLLPADSLVRSQFVCTKWFGLINSSIFIRCHAHQSETVLIRKNLTLSDPGISAALQPLESVNNPKSYFHFLDLDHGDNRFSESSVVGLVDILASHDGLILATMRKSQSLILMNPITRKHIAFPLGTKCDFFVDSFAIAFCDEAKTYKVLHLFREKLVSIGCEILHVSTRKWTRIDGPPSELLVVLRQIPVSIRGSLYWMSLKLGYDYFVSMNVRDEKFIAKKLPVSSGSKDRLLEIGGDLGFLSHAQLHLLQVWILITCGGSGENWIKKYSMDLRGCVAYPNPICFSNNGKRMVLEMKNELYAYNFETGEMKPIQSASDDEVWFGRIDDSYIPHRNTLASWELSS